MFRKLFGRTPGPNPEYFNGLPQAIKRPHSTRTHEFGKICPSPGLALTKIDCHPFPGPSLTLVSLSSGSLLEFIKLVYGFERSKVGHIYLQQGIAQNLVRLEEGHLQTPLQSLPL